MVVISPYLYMQIRFSIIIIIITQQVYLRHFSSSFLLFIATIINITHYYAYIV